MVDMQTIEKVDFEAIHRAIALGDFGDRIWVYQRESDGTQAGSHVVTGSQETPGDIATGTSGPVAMLTAIGDGNLNGEQCYSGFAHQDDDGLWREDSTGKLIGGDGEWSSLVGEAIADGDWTEYYDELRAEVLRQWAE